MAESRPAFAGAWITAWSSIASRSNSVVPVAGSASLFVYAAPATPIAGVAMGCAGGAGGYVRRPSTIVSPSASTLSRRFWPVSLTMRSRSTTGLKSTPKDWPSSATLSWERFVAQPERSSTE